MLKLKASTNFEANSPVASLLVSITYFFEEISEGVGKLKRNQWSSGGANAEILIAEYICYDPDDPVNTSNASYQSQVLTVKLTALFYDARETREYIMGGRPNLN